MTFREAVFVHTLLESASCHRVSRLQMPGCYKLVFSTSYKLFKCFAQLFAPTLRFLWNALPTEGRILKITFSLSPRSPSNCNAVSEGIIFCVNRFTFWMLFSESDTSYCLTHEWEWSQIWLSPEVMWVFQKCMALHRPASGSYLLLGDWKEILQQLSLKGRVKDCISNGWLCCFRSGSRCLFICYISATGFPVLLSLSTLTYAPQWKREWKPITSDEHPDDVHHPD